MSDPVAFCIRIARSSDAASLASLLAACFYEHFRSISWLYALLRWGIYEEAYQRLQALPRHYACFVAVPEAPTSHSQVLGTIEVTLRRPVPWKHFDRPYAYIANLAVDREHRCRGIGRELLAACEPVIRKWDCYHVYLHVLETNERAYRLYHRVGYCWKREETSTAALLLGCPRKFLLCKSLKGNS